MERTPASKTSSASTGRWRVGRWLVDPAADTLCLDGSTVKLEPRTMRLLVTLAERPGEVCPSDDLIDRVWPGIVVTDQSLYQAIGELRSALKADAVTGQFIATVPRKGYRLVAPIGPVGSPDGAPRQEPSLGAPSPPVLPALTVAVLPFRALGLPESLSFLPETFLGDLVLELSRQPGLTTIARGTMLSYRDLAVPPHRVADDLQVRYVVDGCIATSPGDRLSISCDLIDASTGGVVASESIAAAAVDWPSLAQRVVGRLVRIWRLGVTEHASRDVDRGGAAHGALELAMRAWVELYCRPQSRDTNDRAWSWAAEAVRRDPALGAAWNVLAYSEYRGVQFDWLQEHPGATLDDAALHAEQATRLSPSDPDAHYTLGLVLFTSGEWLRAEASLRHCLDISTSYAPAHGLLGLLVSARGRPQEAFEHCARALSLSPREPLRAIWHWGEACAASMLGREDEALDSAARGIAANPAFPTCYLAAAVASRRLGREDEAARFVSVACTTAFCSVERLRERIPAMRVEPWATEFLNDLRTAGLPER